ncbi:MAG: AraC family transcriptional regulator [Burkholderiaceae bacterium]
MTVDALALLDAATRGGAIVLLGLLAIATWRQRRRSGGAAIPLAVALALGLIVQIVIGTPLLDRRLPLRWLAAPVGIAVANSVLFWLFARAVFDDDFKPRRRHLAIWAAVFAISAGSLLARTTDALPRETSDALTIARNLAPLLFAVLAIAATVHHWRVDVVESRRRLRGFVIACGALNATTMVAARGTAPADCVGTFVAWWDVATLLLIVVVITWQALRADDAPLLLRGGRFAASPAPAFLVDDVYAPPDRPLPHSPPPSNGAAPARPIDAASGNGEGAIAPPTTKLPTTEPASIDAADVDLAHRLRQAMTIERAHADETLSIASLAARLDVPEYRLRRVINRQLGHRNFTTFVNGHRLADARAALADPARRELPILTVALDAGFASIGPFNRAFKADTGLTPSAYRRQALADS